MSSRARRGRCRSSPASALAAASPACLTSQERCEACPWLLQEPARATCSSQPPTHLRAGHCNCHPRVCPDVIPAPLGAKHERDKAGPRSLLSVGATGGVATPNSAL